MAFLHDSARFRLRRPTTLILFGAAITSAALLQCVGDDPTTTSTAPAADAGTDTLPMGNDSGARTDAGSTCAWDAPFSTPVPVPGIPTDVGAIEGHPSLSPDELTIYFHGFGGSLSNSSTGDDLYTATRGSKNDAFGAATKLAISTNGPDENASISHDGTTLYYDSTATDSGALSQLWVAQRASASGPFMNPHALGSPPASAQAGITVNDGQPFITDDNAEFWFTSRAGAGTGAVNIYNSLLSDNLFGAPTEQALLDSSSSDYAPNLSADRLTVYFSSGRPNGLGGADDIWRSHRGVATDAFPAPSPVAELNSAADEFGGWLSPDNCHYYFESKRAASGNNNLYLAVRTP